MTKTNAHCEAAKPPTSDEQGLGVAELEAVIEELCLIENTIATLPGLVEHARAIANAFECDEPDRRDPIARLGLRLTGRDVDRFGPSDMRMPDDDLLEGMVDAVNAVVEAATWRLQRLCRVLFRVSEKVDKSKSRQVESQGKHPHQLPGGPLPPPGCGRGGKHLTSDF